MRVKLGSWWCRSSTLLFSVVMAGPGCRHASSPPTAPPSSSRVANDAAPPQHDAELPKPSEPRRAETVAQTFSEHLALRERLDRQLWSPEVEAQRHEDVIVQLWDKLRSVSDELDILSQLQFETLEFRAPGSERNHAWGIVERPLDGASTTLNAEEWKALLVDLRKQGYSLFQSEWHHSQFTPRTEVEGAKSSVSFAIDLVRKEPERRATVRGIVKIIWKSQVASDAPPMIDSISIRDAGLWMRDGAVPFREIMRAKSTAEHPRVMPLLVEDLDGNGGSEVILGGLNQIYWNDGHGQLQPEPLTDPVTEMFDAAIVADFTGDARLDLLCVDATRSPILLRGGDRGRLQAATGRCADATLELPKAFTAGDIDGDGDLDVWIGQYKFPYQQGAMPTPFYDANDGYPAVLLENNGQGQFRDITIAAGLGNKRNRRTYSASLIDLDGDRDLDLITVNDFCGVDVYANDGHGKFSDQTATWLSDRHLFGMGHTFADFDQDGRFDMYVIGMSSTTARRLDQLKLGRDDHPDINRLRKDMGYGNRMLLARGTTEQPRFEQAPWNDTVARTGWSWGTTSTDFDNDGDADIFVANGHTSGQSAKDYCTRYWCHDVYTGSSEANLQLKELFDDSLKAFRQGEISWNGFEHDVFWLNEGEGQFFNVAHLLGVGFEFDSRAVVSDDLDNDGRRDLLVVRFEQARAGKSIYEMIALRNEIPTRHHWIGVRLSPAQTGRSPVGAVVTLVRSDGHTEIRPIVTGDSFSSQHAATAHFGLGADTAIRELTVRWADGSTSAVGVSSVDRYYTIDQ